MNENFFKLSQEKKNKILNASMKVFGAFPYKKASTDDIAASAGISKGLLFYYFHNKKELYLYTYQYAVEMIEKRFFTEAYEAIDDFFELMDYAAKKKIELVLENPYIYNYAVRVYFDSDSEVSDEIADLNKKIITAVQTKYMVNIDLSKFREDVSPEDAVQMLICLSDGYGRMINMKNTGICDMGSIYENFKRWLEILKRSVYKEAYIKDKAKTGGNRHGQNCR